MKFTNFHLVSAPRRKVKYSSFWGSGWTVTSWKPVKCKWLLKSRFDSEWLSNRLRNENIQFPCLQNVMFRFFFLLYGVFVQGWRGSNPVEIGFYYCELTLVGIECLLPVEKLYVLFWSSSVALFHPPSPPKKSRLHEHAIQDLKRGSQVWMMVSLLWKPPPGSSWNAPLTIPQSFSFVNYELGVCVQTPFLPESQERLGL